MVKQPAMEEFLISQWKSGDVFIDVGAGIGYFTFRALDYIRPRGLVIAIEADPYNYDRLKIENKVYEQWNGRSAVLLNLAVTNQFGARYFHRANTHRGLTSINIRADREFQDVKVRTAPLDFLFNHPQFFTDINRIGIKIDVEGAEMLVLDGAHELLDRVDYLAMDYHPAFDIDPVEIGTKLGLAGLLLVESDHPQKRNELFAVRGA